MHKSKLLQAQVSVRDQANFQIFKSAVLTQWQLIQALHKRIFLNIQSCIE